MTTRRKWSAAEKRSIVAEIEAAGGSVSEVARKHGVHTSLLFRWRRNLSAAASRSEPARSTSPVFLPVALSPPVAPIRTARSSVLEIQLAGGRVVRVDADVDAAKLAAIVAELEKTA
ncbi:MAG: transposase [Hyphomicrobiaceae bacterium]|nr:transposase [Hyphomicrobiaceae bacterium]